MPQIFRPYADTVARAILLALVVMPFAGVVFAYCIAGSEYVTDQTIRSINQCRSATSITSAGSASTAATATPEWRRPRSQAYRQPIPA